MTHNNDTYRQCCLGAAALLLAGLCGCASWTNPVANGIPPRVLPPELLAEHKEELERIPLSLLRQRPPELYRLAAGDLLGVYIEGVLGEEGQLPPVNFPQDVNLPPSIGYPIPVREDGTIPVPLIDPVDVDNMSLAEAQQAITAAYTGKSDVLKEGEARILVTLIRPRQTRVLVIREDSPEGRVNVRSRVRGFGSTQISGSSRRGTGSVVELPAYQNDVLTALARTGGLPGTDAEDEVIIQRGYAATEADGGASGASKELEAIAKNFDATSLGEEDVIRIPLRLPRGQRPDFKPDDIILREGDIVFIEARDTEFYYTGGLLPSAELPLPRDYDLSVIEAIAQVGGPMLNGGVNSNNLSGSIVAQGIGNPSPSLVSVLRQTPNGRQVTIRVDLNRAMSDPRENILVRAGDVLLLQETPRQALARYFTEFFNFTLISKVISRTDTTGTTTVSVP